MGEPGQQRIRLRSSARTSNGKVRENNEDSIHLWTQPVQVFAIVADGMGGAAAGEEASRIAVETIREGLVGSIAVNGDVPSMGDTSPLLDEDAITEHMRQAIRTANMTIVQKAELHPEYKGMGTTVTMAFIRNTYAIIGHVGDSRAYLIDGQDGHIIQVTSDHSFVQALVAAGHISEEEADDHPMRNVLYRALGQARDVEIDVYYERLRANDRLVLCSDGLTLHVRPAEIAQLTLAAANPEEASQKLIDLANQRGGRDNVSVIVVKVEAEDDDAPRVQDHPVYILDEDTMIIRHPPAYGSSETLNALSTQDRDGKMSLGDSRREPQASLRLVANPDPNRLQARGVSGEGLREGRDMFLPEQ